tara:strand:+ start:1158 stop:1451 length:294 start_codon:yes stop_codon:yes gene_type:complete
VRRRALPRYALQKEDKVLLLLLLKVFLRFTLHKIIIIVLFFFCLFLFLSFFSLSSFFCTTISLHLENHSFFCVVRDQNVFGSTGIDIDRRPHEGGPA